jgi:Ala-tRNA(Pro) deacylase
MGLPDPEKTMPVELVSPDRPAGAPTTSVAAEWLEDQEIPFRLVEHPSAFSADAEARVAGIPAEHTAKTVLTRDADGYVIAVVPASERLDLAKLRAVTRRPARLRLATEREMARDLPDDVEVGAMPPLGPMLDALQVVDRRLLTYNRLLCSGGDHRHSLLVDTADLVRVSGSLVADICED